MPVSAHINQETKAVRIIKDKKSNDGWIARTREGKVCFIENLGTEIDKLAAGQMWQATITKKEKKYLMISLEFRLDGAMCTKDMYNRYL